MYGSMPGTAVLRRSVLALLIVPIAGCMSVPSDLDQSRSRPTDGHRYQVALELAWPRFHDGTVDADVPVRDFVDLGDEPETGSALDGSAFTRGVARDHGHPGGRRVLVPDRHAQGAGGVGDVQDADVDIGKEPFAFGAGCQTGPHGGGRQESME